MTNLAGTGVWCSAFSNDPAECEKRYITGTSGHVYRCMHDGQVCAGIWSDPVLCCDHFCARLEGKTEVNAANAPAYGGGPWCGARSASKQLCETSYWTGKDLKAYSCLFDNDKCRLSLGEACVCKDFY